MVGNMREFQRFYVRRLTLEDISLMEDVVGLFSGALGEGYLSRDDLEKFLHPDTGHFLLASFLGEIIVGVATASILTDKKTQEFENAVIRAKGALDLGEERVGMLISTAVHHGFRRRGVGSQLVVKRLDILEAEGCTKCVSLAWQSGNKDSSSGILEKFGFNLLATSINHWTKDSIEFNYSCPTCGEPPCLCSAGLYLKSFDPPLSS